MRNRWRAGRLVRATQAGHIVRATQAGELVIRYAYRADPRRAVGSVVVNLAAAISDVMGAVILKLLIDAAARGDEAGVVRAALLCALTFGGSMIGHFASTTIGMALRERTTLYVDTRMAELTAGISGIEHHERPDHLDELYILNINHQRLAGVHDSLVTNATALVRLAITVGILGAIHPLLLLLPLAAIPSVLVSAAAARERVRVEDRLAAVRRLQMKLFEIGVRREAGKELRLFGFGDELVARFEAARAEADRIQARSEGRASVRGAGAWLFFGIGMAAAELLVAREAAAGRATVGDLVLALTMAGAVNHGVQGLASSVAWLLDNLKMGERLVWLEALAVTAAAKAAPVNPAPVPGTLTTGIRFEGVGFRYPGLDAAGADLPADVLAGVDLCLPAGSTVAIVGDNGAGKTTMVKLLCRLYDPTAGRITIDGTDLRDFEVDEWRARLSGCFQDFARLELLAQETVGVGDVSRIHDEPAVVGALERAHAADVPASLPGGLATQLGRTFAGGIEPSTGQWQKLALGRAMMRDAPLLLVLDEPTASLDPETEAALFERYAGAAARAARSTGAITVLVSHRFSTVRMADLIVVMGGGRVAEMGTHEDLLAAGGTYAELYRLQARAYR